MSQPEPRLTTRQKARKRAVDIVFEADLREADLAATLAERTSDGEPPVRSFTADLVRGIAEHELAIDQRIAESLPIEWTLERMPRVDRAIARVAVYELDHTDTPPNVVIAEATELATELSTDSSPGFLNGMLARALSTRPSA